MHENYLKFIFQCPQIKSTVLISRSVLQKVVDTCFLSCLHNIFNFAHCPTKPKIFTIQSFTGKFVDPRSRGFPKIKHSINFRIKVLIIYKSIDVNLILFGKILEVENVWLQKPILKYSLKCSFKLSLKLGFLTTC